MDVAKWETCQGSSAPRLAPFLAAAGKRSLSGFPTTTLDFAVQKRGPCDRRKYGSVAKHPELDQVGMLW